MSEKNQDEMLDQYLPEPGDYNQLRNQTQTPIAQQKTEDVAAFTMAKRATLKAAMTALITEATQAIPILVEVQGMAQKQVAAAMIALSTSTGKRAIAKAEEDLEAAENLHSTMNRLSEIVFMNVRNARKFRTAMDEAL